MPQESGGPRRPGSRTPAPGLSGGLACPGMAGIGPRCHAGCAAGPKGVARTPASSITTALTR